MSRSPDITGKRFGSLIAVERAPGAQKSPRPSWLVRCDCGGTKVVRYITLADGRTKSCGACVERDLIGKTFNRLTVMALQPGRRSNSRMWLARCSCGGITRASTAELQNDRIRSCGCLAREASSKRNTTHGGSRSTEYQIWRQMHRRCTEPKIWNFADYGGRGISVCARWQSFESFRDDMGLRPSRGHTLDRINNDGNYEPGNVRWATPQEQMQHTRASTALTFKGETLTIAEWSRRTGLSDSMIRHRVQKRGWPPERALTTPPDRLGNRD